MSDALWSILLEAPPEALPAFEAALEPHAMSLSTVERSPRRWSLEAVAPAAPDRATIEVAVAIAAAATALPVPEVRIARLETRDWVREGLEALPAVRAGRFHLRGGHLPPAPPGTVDLLVDAGLAFGTGHHPTTWGCLQAIDRLTRRRRFRRPLDMGCGSGVLAMALASVLRRTVTAADNDPVAVRTTTDNARLNRLGALIRPVVAESFAARPVAGGGPYDLIVANILARPLCALAPGMVRVLGADGVVVLSGLLARSEAMVLSAYRAQGLRLSARVARGGWHTLVLRRRGFRRTGRAGT